MRNYHDLVAAVAENQARQTDVILDAHIVVDSMSFGYVLEATFLLSRGKDPSPATAYIDDVLIAQMERFLGEEFAARRVGFEFGQPYEASRGHTWPSSRHSWSDFRRHHLCACTQASWPS